MGKYFSKTKFQTKPISTVGNMPNTMFDAFGDQIIGGSYSSDMNMATFPCLNIQNITYDGDYIVTPFGASQNFTLFISQLMVSASLDNDLWVFSSNPEAIYAKSVNDTQYTQSIYFAETISLPTKIFTPSGSGQAALNPFGQAAYNTSASNFPDIFRSICGDQYITEEQTGAGLFLTMQLNFDRQADKAAFINEVGTIFSSINGTYSTIETYMNKNKPAGNLELLAFQSGGDATQLSQILSKNPATGNYYLTTCDFSSIADCQGAMNAIFEYAGKPFQSQVGYNGQAIGNAISMGFTYGNYTDLDLEVGASVLTPAAISARDEIVQLYLDMKAEMTLVNQVLNSQFGSYTAPITKEIFSNFTEVVNNNNKVITDPINGIAGCYVDPINCLNITANINNLLVPIDMGIIDNVLDGFKTGYAFLIPLLASSVNLPPIKYIPIGDEFFLPINGVRLPTDGITWLFSQQNFIAEGNFTIFNPQTPMTFGTCIPESGGIGCPFYWLLTYTSSSNISIPGQGKINTYGFDIEGPGGGESDSLLIGLSAIDSEIF